MKKKEKSLFPILPSKSNFIGILGGGQLGKMTAMAASKLGFPTSLYCPKGDNPAEEVVTKVLHGSWDNFSKMNKFSSDIVCATSEFENVPSKALDQIAKNVPVLPNSYVFKSAQFRDKEKIIASEAGFNVPKWFKIRSINDLQKFAKQLDFNAVLKTNSLGYDGKGQSVINSRVNLHDVWSITDFSDCILEEKINFKREISILYAKSADQTECFFPISENKHHKGILRKTLAPTFVEEKKLRQIKKLTRNFAKLINLTGLLTIEMFELNDGSILFNEMAPRPHNSYHWTIEGCQNSQFDILIKCICGHSISDQTSPEKWEMNNIIGPEINSIKKYVMNKNFSCHIYGKKEVKSGRKMGHLTKKL